MRDEDGSRGLFERLVRAERASVGIDPDGTAYLDAADRIEIARAAYRQRVEIEERQEAGEPAEEGRAGAVIVAAETL